MHDLIGRTIAERINRTHQQILTLCQPLNNENMTRRVSRDAPPIGWHLWHIARWADHFQASFPNRVQIWHRDDYPVQWIVDTTLLGPMEAGMGMPVLTATELVQKVGYVRLMDYARIVFEANREALRGIDSEQLHGKRVSIARHKADGDKIIEAPGVETTTIEDCMLHLTHANRHLGMIEALIGATLERKGTATV